MRNKSACIFSLCLAAILFPPQPAGAWYDDWRGRDRETGDRIKLTEKFPYGDRFMLHENYDDYEGKEVEVLDARDYGYTIELEVRDRDTFERRRLEMDKDMDSEKYMKKYLRDRW